MLASRLPPKPESGTKRNWKVDMWRIVGGTIYGPKPQDIFPGTIHSSLRSVYEVLLRLSPQFRTSILVQYLGQGRISIKLFHTPGDGYVDIMPSGFAHVAASFLSKKDILFLKDKAPYDTLSVLEKRGFISPCGN